MTSTDPLRLAVPPDWEHVRPEHGPLVLLATGPPDPATGTAPTLACSLDGDVPFGQLLRRMLATMTAPRVLAVEVDATGRDVFALVSHDLAGFGSTVALQHLRAWDAVITGTAPDLAWPRVGPALLRAVRTAGS